jgi:putative CocE/NonD family hydrolase
VTDQRFVADRTDVLTYTTEPLAQSVHILGQPQVNLFASTSGTDSDWVVKLIDVYPEEMSNDPKLAGYQLGIGMEIFRGRYGRGFDTPSPLKPGQAEHYRFALPGVNHRFARGHRIMVQVQSSWFPLYDRNPQTYVPNIFNAKPADYQKATQRIYRGGEQASAVLLPVMDE